MQTKNLTDMVQDQDLREARSFLLSLERPTLVDELERLGPELRAMAYRLLPKSMSVGVFELLPPELQAELVAGLRSRDVARLVAELDPDDRGSMRSWRRQL